MIFLATPNICLQGIKQNTRWREEQLKLKKKEN